MVSFSDGTGFSFENRLGLKKVNIFFFLFKQFKITKPHFDMKVILILVSNNNII